MAWAALGKSLLKSGVKKVATKKLLNRKGKPKVGMVKAEKLMGGDNKEKGGAIVKSGSSNIVPVSSPITSITKAETQTKSGSLMVIKEKVLEIDKLLKGTLAAEKAQQKNQRKQQEKDERKQDEQEIEGAPKLDKKRFNLPLPKQVTSFWGQIKRYFMTVLFGWLAVRLIDWLPKLMPLLKGLARFLDFVVYLGGIALNILVTAVDWGYKAYDWTRGAIKNLFGEKAAEQFDKFSGVLKNVIMGVAAIGTGFAIMAGVFAKARLAATASQVAGGAAGATAGGSVAGIGAGATAGIVAGAGLLASGLGEGIFQLGKKGYNIEEDWRQKADKKWWTDPRKYWWGISAGLMGFLNRSWSLIGGILDIVGAPFRMIVELIRFPFLSKEGKEKQRTNLEKYDARIREQFRKALNAFDFLGVINDDEGSWGSLYGDAATDKMGYTKDGKTKSEQDGTANTEGNRGFLGWRSSLDFATFGMFDFDKHNRKGSPKDWGIRRIAGGLTDFATMGLTDFDKRGRGNMQFDPISGGKDKRWGSVDEQAKRREKQSGMGIKRGIGGALDFATFGMFDFDKQNKKGAPKGWGLKRIAGGLADAITMGTTDFDKRGAGIGQYSGFTGDKDREPTVKRRKTSSISSTSNISAYFDFERGVGVINGKDVSVEEYTNFQNLSQREKLQQYGQVKGNGNNILPLDVNSVKAKGVSEFASYEDGSDEEIVVVAPSPSKSNQYQDKEESFVPLVLGGGGGGEDPYSNLYEGG